MKNAKLWFLATVILVVSLRFYGYFTKEFAFNDGDRIRITTTLHTEPVRYDNARFVRLSGLKVYLPLFPDATYGDNIVVEGVVDSGRLINVELVRVDPSDGVLYKLRRSLLEFYESHIPLPHSSLVSGMVIGSKSGMPQDFWEVLKNSGTAHVVVASGMNVSLVGGFLMGFFTLFLKRRKAILFALAGIWQYAVLSGFDAPVVRAAIMGSIAFSAQELGRLNYALRALIFTAIIMLILNPGYIGDVGFLLSFFATLGIILFEPKVGKLMLRKMKPISGKGFMSTLLRKDLASTISAQIGVVPILLVAFGKFNLLSPIANILVLWTVVPITILGMAGGLIGLVVPPIGQGVLLLSYPLTLWFISVVQIFG